MDTSQLARPAQETGQQVFRAYQSQNGQDAVRNDEYGKPIAGHGANPGMGAQAAAGAFTGTGRQVQPSREDHTLGAKLNRSGSSSSISSSEDDGMGGRRKKGMKEKIKEKFPGGHKENQQQTTATRGAYGQQGHAGMTGTGMHGTDGTDEKKGIMEKIKEKLPGQH